MVEDHIEQAREKGTTLPMGAQTLTRLRRWLRSAYRDLRSRDGR